MRKIFKQRMLTTENSKDLQNLMQTTYDKQIPLLNNGQPIDQKDTFFVYFLAERLLIETRKTLEFSTPKKNLSATTSSRNFSKKNAKLFNHHICDRHPLVINSSTDGIMATNMFQTNVVESGKDECECCGRNHRIYEYDN